MERITLEEAKTLEAFAKYKNIAKTALFLKKANSAVVYSLDSLERKSGLKLLDRSGYRTEILPAGERVLEACQVLLSASDQLKVMCEELKSGWESDLNLIIEGIVPIDPILRGIKSLSDQKSPTRFQLQVEFMNEVESTFLKTGANLMISVMPPEQAVLSSVFLFDFPAYLVASRKHSLVNKGKVSLKNLKEFPLLTVRGSNPKLNMTTAPIESHFKIQFNDFHTKKSAIENGLGFGWLPEYLIKEELRSGKLKLIEWEKSNRHLFKAHLYHRGEMRLGKTAKAFIQYLSKQSRMY